MIRLIAAIDAKRGIATDTGIPWNLPTDKAYYRDKVRQHPYVIGYGTYLHHSKPLPDTPMFVASRRSEPLREGFEKVINVRKFLQEATQDVWVGGGAGLFESVIDLADELYLTLIEGDFSCTKFFPEYESKFTQIGHGMDMIEGNLHYSFTVWRKSGTQE